MSNNFEGTNEEGLDKLIIDLYNNLETMKKTFDDINEIVGENNDWFNSDCGNEFFKKFSNMNEAFFAAQNKVEKYIDELSNVKLRFSNLNDDISIKLNKSASEIERDFSKTIVE